MFFGKGENRFQKIGSINRVPVFKNQLPVFKLFLAKVKTGF